MIYYIIASHHSFAAGLKNTLGFITNLPENVIDINAYLDERDVKQQIEEVMRSIPAGSNVIIMTDMLGGSVNQKFYSYVSDAVHVITGVNIPLALELMLMGEAEITAENIKETIEYARSQIVYMNCYQNEFGDEDE